MTIRRGRAASLVRTPMLVREYLAGSLAFPGDLPGDREARAAGGDYISRMHRRVKARIREISPDYQYPRSASFLSLVNSLITLGLVEKTGRREDPVGRGAGIVGVAGGFEQRTWVALTEGSATRIEWSDPIKYLARIYPNVRQPRVPPPAAAGQYRAGSLEAELDILSNAPGNADELFVIEDGQTILMSFRDNDGVDHLFTTDPAFNFINPIVIAEEEEALEFFRTAHRRDVEEARIEAQGGRLLPEVPTITLPTSFSTRSVPRLINHVEQLVDLAEQTDWPEQPFPALAAEAKRLFDRGTDWRDTAQDSLDSEEGRDSPSEGRLETLEQRRDTLDTYVEALEGEDFSQALEALSDIE